MAELLFIGIEFEYLRSGPIAPKPDTVRGQIISVQSRGKPDTVKAPIMGSEISEILKIAKSGC